MADRSLPIGLIQTLPAESNLIAAGEMRMRRRIVRLELQRLLQKRDGFACTGRHCRAHGGLGLSHKIVSIETVWSLPPHSADLCLAQVRLDAPMRLIATASWTSKISS